MSNARKLTVKVYLVGGVICSSNDGVASAQDIRQVLMGEHDTFDLAEPNLGDTEHVELQFEETANYSSNINRSSERLDSSALVSDDWDELAMLIRGDQTSGNIDGVVVLHGLDTIVYSASALSFQLPTREIPVVFTGSQRPLNRTRTDARQNLVGAITIAALLARRSQEHAIVGIFCQDTLFQANRTTYAFPSAYLSLIHI